MVTPIPEFAFRRISANGQAMIKCEECAGEYCPYHFRDCPHCTDVEFEDYLLELRARRWLARQFRSITPEPDR